MVAGSPGFRTQTLENNNSGNNLEKQKIKSRSLQIRKELTGKLKATKKFKRVTSVQRRKQNSVHFWRAPGSWLQARRREPAIVVDSR